MENLIPFRPSSTSGQTLHMVSIDRINAYTKSETQIANIKKNWDKINGFYFTKNGHLRCIK